MENAIKYCISNNISSLYLFSGDYQKAMQMMHEMKIPKKYLHRNPRWNIIIKYNYNNDKSELHLVNSNTNGMVNKPGVMITPKYST